MIFTISWKNIWRNKQRSLVVIFAIAVGLWAGISSVAMMRGTLIQRVDSAISNEVSSLQLHRVEFLDNNETDYTIANADSLMEIIGSYPDVKAVSKRLKTEVMVNSGHGPRGALVLGVEPEKEKSVTKIFECVADSNGTYFGVKRRNPAVISKRLAEKLKVHLHSKIQIDAVSKNGQPVSAVFRVVGIYNTVNAVFDEMNVFVKYDDLARLLGFGKTEAHEIAVLTKDFMDTDSLQSALRQRFTRYKVDDNSISKLNVSGLKPYALSFLKTLKNKEFTGNEIEGLLAKNIKKEDLEDVRKIVLADCETGLNVTSWQKLAPDLELTNQWIDFMLYIFVGIILLALGFGIINTMLMVVLERVKELGMLMAVGMNRKRIYSMVMMETVMLSLAGGVVGIIISLATIQWFSVTGFDLSFMSEGLNSLGYANVIYPEIDTASYIKVVVMVIITGILAALYPAWKAISLNPAEAVRSE
jgi:ABC-type lipoprotein release transport system permease subunit